MSDVEPLDIGQTGKLIGRSANGEYYQGRKPRQDWVNVAERNSAMFSDYYVHNMTQADIAVKYGVSAGTVSEALLKVRQATVDFAAMRAESLALLAEARRRQLEIASKKGAPVTAGKDGFIVVDPDTGEVVRDYGQTLTALRDFVKTDAEIAKRFGLDAPQKAEVATTVRYEVEGLKADDLT